jgi:hypothetical protein
VDDVGNSTALMQNFTNNSYYATMPVIDLNSNYAIAGKMDILSGRCGTQNLSMYNLSNITNMTNFTQTMNLSTCDQFLLSQNLSQNVSTDFSGDLTVLTQSNSIAISKSLLYAVIAPIFSLIITIVFVKELASILGSEIGIRTIASI